MDNPPPPDDHRPQHRCLFGCGPEQTFNSDYELKIHIYTRHWDKNYGAMKCMDCNYFGKTKALLKSHSLKHYNIFPYRCTLCPSQFKWGNKLRTHYLRVHPDSEQGKKYQSGRSKAGNPIGNESQNGAGSSGRSAEGRASPMNQQIGVGDEDSRPGGARAEGRESQMEEQNGGVDSGPQSPEGRESQMDQQNGVKGSNPEPGTSTGPPTLIGPSHLARSQVMFRCLKKGCYSLFPKELEYRSHVLSHVPPTSRGTYACIDCYKEFSTYHQVQLHLREHYTRELVKCLVCKFATCNKEELRAHQASEHDDLGSKTILFFHLPGSSAPIRKKGPLW